MKIFCRTTLCSLVAQKLTNQGKNIFFIFKNPKKRKLEKIWKYSAEQLYVHSLRRNLQIKVKTFFLFLRTQKNANWRKYGNILQNNFMFTRCAETDKSR